MSTSKIAFSALFLLLSLSGFSQSYADYEFIKGQEYHIKTTFEDKPLIGAFIKSDSTGIFIKTEKDPVAGVPFHMIEYIKTSRALLKIEINNESQTGYLSNINDDEITIDTKERKSSIKLEEIDRILVLGKSGVVGRSMAIGSLTMGAVGILSADPIWTGEEKMLAAGGGAVVGALLGLIVGAAKSTPKKVYIDVQIFLNEFEPWLKGGICDSQKLHKDGGYYFLGESISLLRRGSWVLAPVESRRNSLSVSTEYLDSNCFLFKGSAALKSNCSAPCNPPKLSLVSEVKRKIPRRWVILLLKLKLKRASVLACLPASGG